jgi:hypothetical protein
MDDESRQIFRDGLLDTTRNRCGRAPRSTSWARPRRSRSWVTPRPSPT